MRRPGFHFGSRHRYAMLDLLMIDSGKFQHVIEFFVDSERQRDALRRGEMTEERAVTRLMIFNVVEDQRRRIGWMLAIEHVDDGAHFEIPIDVFERRELAALADFIEPVAQAVIVHDGSLGKFINRKDRKIGVVLKPAATSE